MEELIIEAGRTERNYWRDLWRFRELLYFLAYRDILVRYKQTVLGVAWALIKPALTMAVFVAFRRMTKMPASKCPRRAPGLLRVAALAVLLDGAHGALQ